MNTIPTLIGIVTLGCIVYAITVQILMLSSEEPEPQECERRIIWKQQRPERQTPRWRNGENYRTN